MARPKLKSSELIERINALRASGDANSMEIARLKQEAKSLVEVDAVGYWNVLGALADIEGDEQGVREFYGKALRLRPDDWRILFNYSSALANVRRFRDARELGRRAYEKNRASVEILDTLVRQAMHSGRFQEARQWLNEQIKLEPGKHLPNAEAIIEVADYLQDRAIDDDTVEKYVDSAHQIAIARKVNWTDFVSGIQEDEEARWVFIDLIVPVSPTEATDMNEELAETVAALEKLEIPLELVNVMFLAS